MYIYIFFFLTRKSAKDSLIPAQLPYMLTMFNVHVGQTLRNRKLQLVSWLQRSLALSFSQVFANLHLEIMV